MEALDRALRAVRAGRPDAARRLLDEVLAADPSNEEALAWRARVAESPAERAEWLRRALAVNPDNRWARAGLDEIEGGGPPPLGPPPLDPTAAAAASAAAGPATGALHVLQCPSCAGSVELHPGRGAQAAACRYCGSVIDLTTDQAAVLGQLNPKVGPTIPIEPGMEAVLDGERHLVLGWLRYTGHDDEETWTWDEWQLVGDSGAVRYLSHAKDEGFTLQAPVRPVAPFHYADKSIAVPGGRAHVTERSEARITALRGELTWRPRLGHTLQVLEARGPGGSRYSGEWTDGEVELSGGHVLPARAVQQAFNLPATARIARGGTVPLAPEAIADARWSARACFVGAFLIAFAGCAGEGTGTVLLDQNVTVPLALMSDTPALTVGTFTVAEPGKPVEISIDAAITYNGDWAAVDAYVTGPDGEETLVLAGDL
ncbi:MAG TPA: DUF4178 domain-containing protein, partial [Rhodothermales bacterium]|nr:DUF4178 domain-containing protein [Rhodothermales bacterium]